MRALPALLLSALTLNSPATFARAQAVAPVKQNGAVNVSTLKPSDVVREFYRAMREKRFREAFKMSIYAPAIEGLSREELEELRPDFEKLAADVPPEIEINGEQISGDAATVFIKVPSRGTEAAVPEPVTLVREGGAWIVGRREDQELVKKQGKQFFFETRIAAHHDAVQMELQEIAKAQFVHYTKNDGAYADMPTLAREGLIPQEMLTGESLGYRFQLVLAADGKSYNVTAEPLRYNRTGRLSFLMDANGIKSKDNGGKPLKLAPVK